MFTSIEYAFVNFKYQFLGAITLRTRKKTLQKQALRNDGITVYFEDMPQLILQVYILWKTPLQCLNYEWDDGMITYCSIAISILSISATVVPFSRVDEDLVLECEVETPTTRGKMIWMAKCWDLMIKVLSNDVLFCTLLLVLPKLLLISWTISVLKWYSLLLIVPIVVILLFVKLAQDQFRHPEESHWQGLHLLLAMSKDILGYSGREDKLLLPSVVILSSFLIPLSIALHASVNTSFYSEEDKFGIFPSDPYPSSTICFTNASTAMQRDMWENLTMPWSPTCNVTFTSEPCAYHATTRIKATLSCLLVFMSLGLTLVLFIATRFYKILIVVIISGFGVAAILFVFVASIGSEWHIAIACADKVDFSNLTNNQNWTSCVEDQVTTTSSWFISFLYGLLTLIGTPLILFCACSLLFCVCKCCCK